MHSTVTYITTVLYKLPNCIREPSFKQDEWYLYFFLIYLRNQLFRDESKEGIKRHQREERRLQQ